MKQNVWRALFFPFELHEFKVEKKLNSAQLNSQFEFCCAELKHLNVHIGELRLRRLLHSAQRHNPQWHSFFITIFSWFVDAHRKAHRINFERSIYPHKRVESSSRKARSSKGQSIKGQINNNELHLHSNWIGFRYIESNKLINIQYSNWMNAVVIIIESVIIIDTILNLWPANWYECHSSGLLVL